MKKILSLMLLVGATLMQAQEAKTCFVNMPDSLCPLLSAVNRADFIDFLESKMKAEVTNNFGSKSEMTELTADYIRVKMSGQSTWQMKLLPVDDSTRVICTVSTVCAPACDSHIKFYTPDWQELPTTDYLPALPKWEDFIIAGTDLMSVRDTTDIDPYTSVRDETLLMQANLSATEPTLTFTLTTPDYMDKETAEKLMPFLRREIIYKWGRGNFILAH